MTETDTTAVTIEDTDPDLNRDGETEADLPIDQQRTVGSGATLGKEEVGSLRKEGEMGGEIIGGAGVGRSTDRGEVGAWKAVPIS